MLEHEHANRQGASAAWLLNHVAGYLELTFENSLIMHLLSLPGEVFTRCSYRHSQSQPHCASSRGVPIDCPGPLLIQCGLGCHSKRNWGLIHVCYPVLMAMGCVRMGTTVTTQALASSLFSAGAVCASCVFDLITMPLDWNKHLMVWSTFQRNSCT